MSFLQSLYEYRLWGYMLKKKKKTCELPLSLVPAFDTMAY